MKQNKNKETLVEQNKYAELSAESILKWCYDPLNVSMVYSKNLQAPSKDFYKTVEPFFYHDDESNICLECINRYYEYKNKLVRRQDIDILTHHDGIRIKKLFRDKKYRDALLEIFKYNWLVLDSEDLRKDFYDLIKSCLEKKLSVFNVLTFSHIYLLLFNDEAIKKYVMKSVRSHYGKGTFFIQTDHDEWDFMLNYIEYFSNLVYESEKYKDFDIKGWLNAMYIYLSIDGTYYNEKIVDILHKLFFDSDFNAQRKFEIYIVICALVKRQGSLLYRFEDILKNIFDYEFFHFIKATITGETLTTVHIIFWEPIRFYIEFYPEFTKLGLEKKYYSFFSELTDEYYKKELFKVILKNHSCITNLKNFQLTFPFFEEMIINIIKIDDVKRTYFNEMNPMFVRMCVLQTYNFVFKANKYTEADWENLYELLKKWHNITVTIIKENKVKTSYNIKDLSGFILLLYFDISYFLDERKQLKISALYKFFIKNLMTIFLNAPKVFFNDLDQEKLTYINIIKYYFTEDKSYSQLYSFLDENSLTQIIDKHSTFCTKFTYHSVYFTDFLMILSKCKYITIVLYSKVFILLMTKSMQKEILELLCHLVSKIQLHRRDYTTNFILELDWIKALNDLVVEHDTQHLKIVLIAKHFKFLIDNKLVYNEALVDTIRKTCKYYGIINITETANKISPNAGGESETINDQVVNQKKQKLVSLISDVDSSSSSCKIIQKNSDKSVIEPLSLFKNDKSNLGSTSFSNSDITITKIIQNGNNVKKVNDSNENAQYISDEGIKK